MKNQDVVYLMCPEIAKLLRVAPGKVLGWIRKGELLAVDIGNGGRRQFRVSREALSSFLEAREVQRPPARPAVRRRRPAPPGGPLDPELGKQLAKKGQAELVNGKYYRVWDGIILFY